MEYRGEVSQKQKIIKVLEDAFLKAKSQKDFLELIQTNGLNLYSRNEKIVGVKENRKYRFKTLGYNDQLLKSLNRDLSKRKRLHAIEKIRKMVELGKTDRKR